MYGKHLNCAVLCLKKLMTALFTVYIISVSLFDIGVFFYVVFFFWLLEIFLHSYQEN